MKAAEFQVVVEARRAAKEHLTFFNQMMAAKDAAGTKRDSRTGVGAQTQTQKKSASAGNTTTTK